MRNRGLIFLLCAMTLMLFCGCKKDGVVLLNTALRDNPKTAKGEYKWVTQVNRGQVVKIIKEEGDQWYEVQLSDGETKGWIEQKYIHKGEKKIVSFSDQTKMYSQPDENSKVSGTFPAGTKAIVTKEKGDWTEVNIRWGVSGWIQKSNYSLDSDVTNKVRYDVYIAGIGKCSVEASSTLDPSTGTYTVNKMFDGNPGTAWQEGESGDGQGEWIEITFPQPVSVNVSLINGMAMRDSKYAEYGADGDLYLLNSRIKSLRVEAETDGGPGIDQREVSFNDDTREFQDVGTFNNIFKIKLQIDGVFPGLKWNDTSIGEIRIVKAGY